MPVDDGVFDSGFCEAVSSQHTGVTSPAGPALSVGIIATDGELEGKAELVSKLHDLCLGHVHERGFHPNGSSPGAALGDGQGCEGIEGLHVRRTAVGIAAVVHGIGADEDGVCAQNLCPAEGKGQEDRVSCGHIGFWNAETCVCMARVRDRAVSQEGGSTELVQFYPNDSMVGDAEVVYQPGSSAQFAFGMLSIGHGQGVHVVSLVAGPGKYGTGVQATAQQKNSLFPGLGRYHGYPRDKNVEWQPTGDCLPTNMTYSLQAPAAGQVSAFGQEDSAGLLSEADEEEWDAWPQEPEAQLVFFP